MNHEVQGDRHPRLDQGLISISERPDMTDIVNLCTYYSRFPVELSKAKQRSSRVVENM